VSVTGSIDAATNPAPVANGVVDSSLSYIGTGFNVGGMLLIGAVIVLLGVGLCVIGAKMSKRRSA